MRHVLPFLMLVFVLCTGACAGRQVRSTHAYAPPPRAEIAAAEVADADIDVADVEDESALAADPGACPAAPVQGKTDETMNDKDVEVADAAPAAPTLAPAVVTTPARPAVAKRHRAPKPAVSAAESGREAAGLTLPAVSTADVPPLPAAPAVVTASVLAVPSIAIPEPATSRTAMPSKSDGPAPSDAPAVSSTAPSRAPPFMTFTERLVLDWPIYLVVLIVGVSGGILLSRRRPSWAAFDERMEASRPAMSYESDEDEDDDDTIVDEKQPEPAPSMTTDDANAPKRPAPLPPSIFTRREPRVGPVPLPGLPPIRTPIPAPNPVPAGSDQLKTSEIAEAVSGNTFDQGTDVPKEPENLPKVIIYEPPVSTHLN